MAAFEYQALDAQGGAVHGFIEADSERLARATLRSQGMIPLNVNAVGQDPSLTPWWRRSIQIGRAHV